MKNLKIAIIGDSPATYVCAIYLFTANIKPVVIRNKMKFDYSCKILPGLEANKEEYDQKCYEQAANMGINIIKADTLKVRTNDGQHKYLIEYDNQVIEADIIVTDISLGIDASETMYIVEDMVYSKEAIILGGEGCKIAFHIKEACNQ